MAEITMEVMFYGYIDNKKPSLRGFCFTYTALSH